MSCGSTSIFLPACTAANRASAAFLLLTKAAPEVALVIRMRANRAFWSMEKRGKTKRERERAMWLQQVHSWNTEQFDQSTE